MSEKRTSDESEEDNAKRARHSALSNTTLQDLPLELMERILVKTVVMEAIGSTSSLAKTVWEECAGPVLKRLTTVCSQWATIISTKVFRKELQRSFDAEEIVHMEIVLQFQLPDNVYDAVPLKDELLVVRKPQHHEEVYCINVYDRNNMAKVKDVIPLPAGTAPTSLVPCSVTNCLYGLGRNEDLTQSIMKIKRRGEHEFRIATIVSYASRQVATLAVDDNGNIYKSAQREREKTAVITVYDPKGTLVHETLLTSEVYEFYHKIMPTSGGSFITVATTNQKKTRLVEFDKTGTILRQYQSVLFGRYSVSHAGLNGRIVITERIDRVELLDSEFTLLQEFRQNGPNEHDGKYNYCCRMHYDRDRREAVTIALGGSLTIFRFTEE